MIEASKTTLKYGPKIFGLWVAVAFLGGLITYDFKTSIIALLLTLAFFLVGFMFVHVIPIFLSIIYAMNGINKPPAFLLSAKYFYVCFWALGIIGIFGLIYISFSQTGSGTGSMQFVLSIAIYPLGVSIGAAKLLINNEKPFENNV